MFFHCHNPARTKERRLFLERLEDRTLPSVTIASTNNNGQGYAALDFNHSGGYVPPDTNGAAGPLNACLVAGQMIAAGKAATAMVLATEVENNAQFWPENMLGIEETGSALILEPSAGDDGFATFWFQAFPEYVESLNTYTTGRNNLPVMAIE